MLRFHQIDLSATLEFVRAVIHMRQTMSTKTFQARHSLHMAHVEDLLECDLIDFGFIKPKEDDEAAFFGFEKAEDETEDEAKLTLHDDVIEIFHVTSKSHLGRFLLQHPAAKQILVEQILHYGRVCNIEIISYNIVDNHFHMKIGMRRDSFPRAKFMAGIKQQFTNRFKAWFNKTYRPGDRHRKKELTNGTLWNGPSHYEKIEDDAQFAACMLYIENNRLVIDHKAKIGELEEPPFFLEADDDPVLGPANHFLMKPPYEDLLEKLKGYKYQSARWYLFGDTCRSLCLTDGTDGNWATPEEVEIYHRTPVSKLPTGWRKVWFKERFGFLKPTHPSNRRYPTNDFFNRLGATQQARSANLGRLLLASCYKQRKAISKISDAANSSLPGVEF